MPNLTRIKNNQITDSTLMANTKVVAGSIVGSLFNSNITTTADFTITGNLTVLGASTTMTVSATNTEINDPLMVLNNDATGSNTVDVGLVFERGDDTNQSLIWDESADEFVFASTSEDGTTAGDTVVSAYAGLHVGTVKSSALTSGRVTFATTDGALTDASQLTYASSVLTVDQLTLDGTAAGVTIGTLAASGEDLVLSADSGTIDASAGTLTNLADPTLDSDAVTLGYLNTALSSEVTNIQSDDTDVTITDNGVNPGYIQINVDGTLVANVLTGGVTITQPTSLTANTSSTTTTTGALIVSGGVGVAENIVAGGQLKLTDTTESTSVTTGTFITAGGVGIAKNLNVGGGVVITGNLTVNGTTTTVSSTTLDVADLNITLADGAADSASANGAGLTIDGASATLLYTHATTSWDVNKPFKTTDTTDSTSPTTGALLSDGGLGVAKDVFIGGGDLGTNQTTFNLINTTATTLNIGGAATTLELGAASGTTSVNNALTVDGATTAGSTLDVTGVANFNNTTTSTSNTTGAVIIDGGLGLAENLHMGGLADIDGALTVGGAVNVDDTTESTSTTTGAVIVDGGVGVAKSLVTGAGATINASQTAGADFTVKSDNSTTMLYIDGTNDQMVIGGSNTSVTTGAVVRFNTNDSIHLPVGTTAQRPITGVAGMVRFNNSTNNLEFYNGSSWQSAQGSFTVIASEAYDGDDSTTAFTLSDTQTTASCIVSVNGVVQQPTESYSVSGTTLTFTEAPATGDKIEVRKLTTTTTVTSLVDGLSAVTVSATEGASIEHDENGVTVGTSATTIDSFATTSYRSAEYLVQGQNAAGNAWEIAKILLVHNGTTATIVQYGVVDTGSENWTYSATISGGNVLLQAQAGEAGTTVKVFPTYIVV